MTELDTTRPGEPLPIGAHAPDADEPQPTEPPGMPELPDELDRHLAEYIDDTFSTGYTGYGSMRKVMRPDAANVQVARRGGIAETVKPRSVREALLVQVQSSAYAEHEAAKEWANGVRAQQEGRASYLVAKSRREEAEAALAALDLWTEADNEPEETEEAPEPERIPDAHIL